MINFENHYNVECIHEPFESPETVARAQWNGVNGIPHIFIDGKYNLLGATSGDAAYGQYRERIVQRREETGGLSPVEITGSYAAAGGSIVMRASFRVVDPVALLDVRATLLVYEDSVHADGQFYFADTWNHATRVIRDSLAAFLTPTVPLEWTVSVPSGPVWNPENLHVVAYLQRVNGDREIYQGALLPRAYDVTMTPRVRSCPAENGEVLFFARLRNSAASSETFVLEPGFSFGNWIVELSGCGRPVFGGDPIEVSLGPGEECAWQVRVRTGAEHEIRTGGPHITGHGLSSDAAVRVFNGSPAVMLIDSNPHPDYAPMSAALTESGFLFDDWAWGQGLPGPEDLLGFDLLICDSEYFGSLVTYLPADSVLRLFLDTGGGVFLAGQSVLDDYGDAVFLRDYFGVADRLLDQRYTAVVGVPGDPIGDGLDLHPVRPRQARRPSSRPTFRTSSRIPSSSASSQRGCRITARRIVRFR